VAKGAIPALCRGSQEQRECGRVGPGGPWPSLRLRPGAAARHTHSRRGTARVSRYLIRRLLITIPSLLGISVVLFTVLALAPGDPFSELATNPAIPPSVQAALRAKFGLDDPIPVRYLHWLTAMLHGDWGFSFVSHVDVSVLILQRLPVTLGVIGASQVLALLIALPIGVMAATRPYSVFDQIASTFALIGFSLPTFFTGIVFILIFSIRLDWLPFVFRSDLSAPGLAWWWAEFKQSIMPIAVLGLFQGATWTRFVRSAALDVIRLDYVTTARSKGLSEGGVIIKHVVRNAMIPVVTLVALQMPIVFGGAIVTEQIFRVPGIGSLLISAILANDTPVIMAVTFVFACLVILFNLIADLLYGWLDPRISYR
jgi:peptide/nickel transport system permease protein